VQYSFTNVKYISSEVYYMHACDETEYVTMVLYNFCLLLRLYMYAQMKTHTRTFWLNYYTYWTRAVNQQQTIFCSPSAQSHRPVRPGSSSGGGGAHQRNAAGTIVDGWPLFKYKAFKTSLL